MSARHAEGRAKANAALFVVIVLALTVLAIGLRVASDLRRWC